MVGRKSVARFVIFRTFFSGYSEERRNRTRRRAGRPAPHLRLQAKGVIGAGHPSLSFKRMEKTHASRAWGSLVTKAREASCTHLQSLSPHETGN